MELKVGKYEAEVLTNNVARYRRIANGSWWIHIVWTNTLCVPIRLQQTHCAVLR